MGCLEPRKSSCGPRAELEDLIAKGTEAGLRDWVAVVVQEHLEILYILAPGGDREIPRERRDELGVRSLRRACSSARRGARREEPEPPLFAGLEVDDPPLIVTVRTNRRLVFHQRITIYCKK